MDDSPRADPATLRRDYDKGALTEADLAGDWLTQFGRWLDEAVAASDRRDANAMVLATGGPSARTVLLRAYDERGFVFYSHRASRKGREIRALPRAGLCFTWLLLERQVSITGTVAEVTAAQSDAYFATRPRGAQLGAWASEQSAVLGSRIELEAAADAVAKRYPAQVPRPAGWGGFRVVPETVEFWQGRLDRLHDRLWFRRTGPGWAAPTDTGGWVVERLAP